MLQSATTPSRVGADGSRSSRHAASRSTSPVVPLTRLAVVEMAFAPRPLEVVERSSEHRTTAPAESARRARDRDSSCPPAVKPSTRPAAGDRRARRSSRPARREPPTSARPESAASAVATSRPRTRWAPADSRTGRRSVSTRYATGAKTSSRRTGGCTCRRTDACDRRQRRPHLVVAVESHGGVGCEPAHEPQTRHGCRGAFARRSLESPVVGDDCELARRHLATPRCQASSTVTAISASGSIDRSGPRMPS